MKIYKTSEIAKLVHAHPNTIRLYEAWGFLSPIPRAKNNYRQYSDLHLEQIKLVRLVQKITWLGGDLRKQAHSVLYNSAEQNFNKSLKQAAQLKQMIDKREVQAEQAVHVLEQWSQNRELATINESLLRKDAAKYLDITIDALRTWERNGLVTIPRNTQNRYREYGTVEINRLIVIRTLRQARFSMLAILRMLKEHDSGKIKNLRKALDTPPKHVEIFVATDHWLTTLGEIQEHTSQVIQLLNKLITNNTNPP